MVATLTATIIAPAKAGPSSEPLVAVANATLPKIPVPDLLSPQVEPTLSAPEATGDHPEPELLDRELAMQLVNRAPENLRAPAVLYYVDGLEQEQVAKTLGVSRRTVINRLNEFMTRSRKFLAREKGAA